MTRLQAMMAGLLGSLMAFAGLAAFLLIGLGQANASPPAQTQPPAANSAAQQPTGAQPAAGTTDQKPAAIDAQHYADLLVQNMATGLGVDQAKLNSAYTAAAAATLDQAVKDGVMTQEDADKAKAGSNQSLSALVRDGLEVGGKGSTIRVIKDGPPGPKDAIFTAVPAAIAPLFGMTTDQLNAALKDGQTFEALEQAHNVTAQQVRDAALAAVRTAVNAGVTKGDWTQAEADSIYQTFSQDIDNFLTKISGLAGARQENDPQVNAIIDAVEGAVAQTLGLTRDQLDAGLKNEQALPALEQAHNVTHAQVRAAALAAAQAALTTGVQKQEWTQPQADTLAPNLGTLVDKVLAKMGAPLPEGASPQK